MNYSQNPLKFNVGFLLSQPVGASRDFSFEFPELDLGADLKVSKILGKAVVGRTAQAILAQCDFQAFIPLECVRCLDIYDQKLEARFDQVYVLGQRLEDEAHLLLTKDANIDLNSLVKEYMLLEVPICPLCRPDCRGLCPDCGENLNVVDCGHVIEDEQKIPQGRLGALLETALREQTEKGR